MRRAMTSSKITDPAYIETMLASLRAAFLAELPERVAELERLTMALAAAPMNPAVYDELYRRVHSLKGSAGTHGLAIVSTICHQFEDRLNEAGAQPGRSGKSLMDDGLRYVDLIERAQAIAAMGGNDFTVVDRELEALRCGASTAQLVGLVAETSATMAGVYRDALAELPVALSFVSDGLDALSRLLHERFDFLVAGNALKTLKGVALVSALRLSDSPNRAIPVFLLTSAGIETLPAGLRVDQVIVRDPSLPKRLEEAVRALSPGRHG
jgi:HPt (histidine-containing phosphotransfer) domain-containing protein